jgi:protein-S-isoprenylcysteine O-methyltransferase Ste14
MNDSALTSIGPATGLVGDLRRGSKAYDLMAAVPLVVWYGLSAIGQFEFLLKQVRKLALEGPDLTLVLTILSKLAVVLFAVVIIGLLFARRPPNGTARGVLPRIMAILGTYLSIALLMLPQQLHASWLLAVSAALILGGTAFAAYGLLFLGRSISMMPEARRLVTKGPYSIVRHPLYLGEEIAFFGAALQFLSVWTPFLLAGQVCCQLWRMHFEEKVLEGSFPEYAVYKTSTWRILPGVY